MTMKNSGRKVRLAAGATAGAMMLSLGGSAMAQTQGNQVDQSNQGNLISALNNINAETQALNDVEITDVRVVNVEDVANNNNVLNNALNNNSVDIDALQDFLNGNEVIVEALNGNDINIEDVVAIDVLSDGTVVVFVQ